ncbi:MAG: hypothetical protein VX642_07090 [Bdellovibrionota bacterium]|nr:hypothetical protein [Bdellovibrionota bacterium]
MRKLALIYLFSCLSTLGLYADPSGSSPRANTQDNGAIKRSQEKEAIDKLQNELIQKFQSTMNPSSIEVDSVLEDYGYKIEHKGVSLQPKNISQLFFEFRYINSLQLLDDKAFLSFVNLNKVKPYKPGIDFLNSYSQLLKKHFKENTYKYAVEPVQALEDLKKLLKRVKPIEEQVNEIELRRLAWEKTRLEFGLPESVSYQEIEEKASENLRFKLVLDKYAQNYFFYMDETNKRNMPGVDIPLSLSRFSQQLIGAMNENLKSFLIESFTASGKKREIHLGRKNRIVLESKDIDSVKILGIERGDAGLVLYNPKLSQGFKIRDIPKWYFNFTFIKKPSFKFLAINQSPRFLKYDHSSVSKMAQYNSSGAIKANYMIAPHFYDNSYDNLKFIVEIKGETFSIPANVLQTYFHVLRPKNVDDMHQSNAARNRFVIEAPARHLQLLELFSLAQESYSLSKEDFELAIDRKISKLNEYRNFLSNSLTKKISFLGKGWEEKNYKNSVLWAGFYRSSNFWEDSRNYSMEKARPLISFRAGELIETRIKKIDKKLLENTKYSRVVKNRLNHTSNARRILQRAITIAVIATLTSYILPKVPEILENLTSSEEPYEDSYQEDKERQTSRKKSSKIASMEFDHYIVEKNDIEKNGSALIEVLGKLKYEPTFFSMSVGPESFSEIGSTETFQISDHRIENHDQFDISIKTKSSLGSIFMDHIYGIPTPTRGELENLVVYAQIGNDIKKVAKEKYRVDFQATTGQYYLVFYSGEKADVFVEASFNLTSLESRNITPLDVVIKDIFYQYPDGLRFKTETLKTVIKKFDAMGATEFSKIVLDGLVGKNTIGFSDLESILANAGIYTFEEKGQLWENFLREWINPNVPVYQFNRYLESGSGKLFYQCTGAAAIAKFILDEYFELDSNYFSLKTGMINGYSYNGNGRGIDSSMGHRKNIIYGEGPLYDYAAIFFDITPIKMDPKFEETATEIRETQSSSKRQEKLKEEREFSFEEWSSEFFKEIKNIANELYKGKDNEKPKESDPLQAWKEMAWNRGYSAPKLSKASVNIPDDEKTKIKKNNNHEVSPEYRWALEVLEEINEVRALLDKTSFGESLPEESLLFYLF